MDLDLESKLIALDTQLSSMIFDDSESNLISLVTQLSSMMFGVDLYDELRFKSLLIQILRIVSSLDLESQPKPKSEIMSLIIQTKFLFNSMDLSSQQWPLSKLISILTYLVKHPIRYSHGLALDVEELDSLIGETLRLEPELELISLIYQIVSLVKDTVMNLNDENIMFCCPQAIVVLGEDYVLDIVEEVKLPRKYNKWDCLGAGRKCKSTRGEGNEYFFCKICFGQNHERYKKAQVEIKHPLHPKHSLRLVYLVWSYIERISRKCYCCDEDLSDVIYCCMACDYAMNVTCVEKPLFLSRDHSEWHEHTLSLFPRKASLTCNLCGLADSSGPFYICPPCDFSVHQRCLSLPHVIRISPHRHRISLALPFRQGSLTCGVCRKQMHNDYGGYSCIKKDGCSYVAHSRCATQSNIWDGLELERVQDETEQVHEPFVKISDGIIRHFSHQHHHLRLDDNTERDYDEDKLCQACITPIYFGNIYSCMQCDFILHEKCANLSRETYHPIHPHMLTLCDSVIEDYDKGSCSACGRICTTGFFYKCGKEECDFKVHVQCGTISEPLVHGSHIHPLFLTSKPGEKRRCSLYTYRPHKGTYEMFNCIECDFSLCFDCVVIPEKVRYKHVKHMLSLHYGNETSTMESWCEVCEGKIDQEKRFYVCDEDCCVTLHVGCVTGRDSYMKIGSSWFYKKRKVEVLANNMHMSRPFCYVCRRRCRQKIVLRMSGLIIRLCSMTCMHIFCTERMA